MARKGHFLSRARVLIPSLYHHLPSSRTSQKTPPVPLLAPLSSRQQTLTSTLSQAHGPLPDRDHISAFLRLQV